MKAWSPEAACGLGERGTVHVVVGWGLLPKLYPQPARP